MSEKRNFFFNCKCMNDIDTPLILKCSICGQTFYSVTNVICYTEDNSTPSLCDILCAKIYNDTVEPLSLDEIIYYKLYKVELNIRQREIYGLCNGILFQQLPLIHNLDEKENVIRSLIVRSSMNAES